ncbi:hypothetical protein Taro_020866 [Colocasia esculenta]|uniref:Uncharacterized protein n=1 Tax=Colocasia esculenta TaxID=4460 RepID=A0A843V0U8_COLES|nr:hypothetical protein [Colocasia esculenta]
MYVSLAGSRLRQISLFPLSQILPLLCLMERLRLLLVVNLVLILAQKCSAALSYTQKPQRMQLGSGGNGYSCHQGTYRTGSGSQPYPERNNDRVGEVSCAGGRQKREVRGDGAAMKALQHHGGSAEGLLL